MPRSQGFVQAGISPNRPVRGKGHPAARTRTTALGVGLAVALLLVAGCDSGAGHADTIRVYAPTSMTEAMPVLATMYSSAHAGVRVQTSFGPDSELAGRATTGTSIVITQDPAKLPEPVAGTTRVAVASNQFVIVVAPGDPKGVIDLATLAKPGIRVAMCAATEPCGAAASILTKAGLVLPDVSAVPDVRAACTLVAKGAADAALVYRTDGRAAEAQLETMEFIESAEVVVEYHASASAGSDPGTAKDFLGFLTSNAAQEALSNVGFQPVTS
jgi:molybdate transport system substrate-binding protein